jgi:chromosome partitioning protein
MPKRKGAEAPSHPSMPSPRIIAIANNKGGVGKTTTAINLTGALVTHEKRVLLIDLDPQANASIGLNVLIAPTAFGTKLLLQDDRYTIAECVYEKSPFLDVIPSHRTLADTQHTLLLDPDGRTRLRTKLQTGGKPYDVILLDCPPEVGLLSQSALVAATDVLIPVDVGYFSVDGLENMLEIVERIKHSHNPSLNLFGILVTKFDARTTLAQTTIETIRKAGVVCPITLVHARFW